MIHFKFIVNQPWAASALADFFIENSRKIFLTFTGCNHLGGLAISFIIVIMEEDNYNNTVIDAFGARFVLVGARTRFGARFVLGGANTLPFVGARTR